MGKSNLHRPNVCTLIAAQAVKRRKVTYEAARAKDVRASAAARVIFE